MTGRAVRLFLSVLLLLLSVFLRCSLWGLRRETAVVLLGHCCTVSAFERQRCERRNSLSLFLPLVQFLSFRHSPSLLPLLLPAFVPTAGVRLAQSHCSGPRPFWASSASQSGENVACSSAPSFFSTALLCTLAQRHTHTHTETHTRFTMHRVRTRRTEEAAEVRHTRRRARAQQHHPRLWHRRRHDRRLLRLESRLGAAFSSAAAHAL